MGCFTTSLESCLDVLYLRKNRSGYISPGACYFTHSTAPKVYPFYFSPQLGSNSHNRHSQARHVLGHSCGAGRHRRRCLQSEKHSLVSQGTCHNFKRLSQSITSHRSIGARGRAAASADRSTARSRRRRAGCGATTSRSRSRRGDTDRASSGGIRSARGRRWSCRGCGRRAWPGRRGGSRRGGG